MTNVNEAFNGKFAKDQIEKGLKDAGWDQDIATRFHEMVEKYNAQQDANLSTLQNMERIKDNAKTVAEFNATVEIEIPYGEYSIILADYYARIYAAFNQSYYLEMNAPFHSYDGPVDKYIIEIHGFEK